MKYRERHANGLRCLCNGIVISEISQVSTDDCFAAFYLVTSRSACASLKETMTLYQNRRVSARRFCYALMRQWTREWQNAGMGAAGRGGFRRRNGGIGAMGGARGRVLRTQSVGSPRLVAPFGAASPGDTRRQRKSLRRQRKVLRHPQAHEGLHRVDDLRPPEDLHQRRPPRHLRGDVPVRPRAGPPRHPARHRRDQLTDLAFCQIAHPQSSDAVGNACHRCGVTRATAASSPATIRRQA